MLNKGFVSKFNEDVCKTFLDATNAELALTNVRLERLKATRAKNPEWAAYDKYADDIVGIDIRIEEQYAIREELEDNIILLSEQEAALGIESESEAPNKQESIPIQLSLFGKKELVSC